MNPIPMVIHPDARSDFNPTSITGCAPLVLDSSLINLRQYANANDVYSWAILGSDSSTVLSSFQGVLFRSYTMSRDADTTYVRLITSNSYGCKGDTLVRRFTTIKDPVADFSMSDTTGCGDTQIDRLLVLNTALGNGFIVTCLVMVSEQPDPAVTINPTSYVESCVLLLLPKT